MWQAHPRTKGSDRLSRCGPRDRHISCSDRFLGARISRCRSTSQRSASARSAASALLDDMNNWAGPKYLIAEGDTYMKYPDDETFGQLIVNYVKLRSRAEVRRGLDAASRAHARRRLLRLERRSTDCAVTASRGRARGALQCGSGMDVPAGVCRAGVGRRRNAGPADRLRDGSGAVQHPQVPHSVRSTGKNGFGSPPGIRRATERSRSRCSCGRAA